jgi:DNA-binding transcriptional MerR regulator
MRTLPSFLPRHKVAEELGISISTIKRWEKKENFPPITMKLFGKDYFYFPDIIDWMNLTNREVQK